jgi:hypothetical protein
MDFFLIGAIQKFCIQPIIIPYSIRARTTGVYKPTILQRTPRPSATTSSSSPRKRTTWARAPKQRRPLQHRCMDSLPKTTMEVDPLRWWGIWRGKTERHCSKKVSEGGGVDLENEGGSGVSVAVKQQCSILAAATASLQSPASFTSAQTPSAILHRRRISRQQRVASWRRVRGRAG